MTHTLLFDEGLWDIHGTIVDASGNARDVTLDARVVHWPGVWLIEAKSGADAPADEASELTMEVNPVENDARHTTWTGFDNVMGKQHGHFAFVDHTIISSFEGNDGSRRGAEVFRKVDDDTYESLGAIFEGSQRISSWTRTLTRRPAK